MSEGITGAQCRNALATPSPVCTGTRSRSDKVICSIHRFGQLTWLSPGGGPRARAQGQDREHGGSRGREGCFPPRAETLEGVQALMRPLEGVQALIYIWVSHLHH